MNKKILYLIISLLIFSIVCVVGYNRFSDKFIPENKYIDQRDNEIIEMMNKLRSDRRDAYEPLYAQVTDLQKKLDKLDKDYSIRIDNFKNMLSQRYRDEVSRRCFSGNREDVCDELERNIELSKYSYSVPIKKVQASSKKEEPKEVKTNNNISSHNYDDPSKLDKWFASKHSPLNGYGYSFTTYASKYKVDADFVVCVTWADSQSGKMLTTPNNFGNVGNNDRGDRRGYATPEEGIEAVFKAMTNQYQKESTMIGHFSNGGRKVVGEHVSKVYATSPVNWNNNVKKCMGQLKSDPVDEFYKVK